MSRHDRITLLILIALGLLMVYRFYQDDQLARAEAQEAAQYEATHPGEAYSFHND